MGTLTARRPSRPKETSAPDVAARNEVILRYMPLVRYVARRVGTSYGVPAGVEISDLVSFGLFGLVEAHERFDESRGVKFETFAVPRIRGAIVDELRHIDWVPRNVRTRARRLSDAATVLTARLRRAPTKEEMGDALGLDDVEGYERRGSPAKLLGLEDVLSADPSGGEPLAISDTLIDSGAEDPGSALEDAELKDRLAEALTELDERDRFILTLYYFENVPLGELSRLLGVTESRISQLHTRALASLRRRLSDA